MKKAFLFLSACASILIACHKKAIPEMTNRTVQPEAPKSVTSDVKPDLAIGKVLYETRCARCHDAPSLKKYDEQEWKGYLNTMMPRARMSPEERVHVTAYVKANCKQ